MINNMIPHSLKEIGTSGILDIICLATIIYFLLVWFKRTRAAFVLTGILIITGFYLLTRQFNLTLTAALFENFFAIFLIALVVIFQEELRRLFERVAIWSLNRQFLRHKTLNLSRDEAQILVRTLFDLANDKIGALIVVKGRDLIDRHLEGGTDLNGEISEGLLKSIFDPHSMGHDGAVVIEGNRITQYSCHLPLTKNLKAVGKGGTRHAAALGLSELSDSLCLVVSEERGTISVAKDEEIDVISDPERLNLLIEKHYQDTYPKKQNSLITIFRRDIREKIIAILLAIAAWFVFSHGAKVVYQTFKVPITLTELSKPFVLKDYQPKEVEITVYGPRKAFYFLNREGLKYPLNIKNEKGIQIFHLSSKNFPIPESINLEKIEPREVRIQVDQIFDLGENKKTLFK